MQLHNKCFMLLCAVFNYSSPFVGLFRKTTKCIFFFLKKIDSDAKKIITYLRPNFWSGINLKVHLVDFALSSCIVTQIMCEYGELHVSYRPES